MSNLIDKIVPSNSDYNKPIISIVCVTYNHGYYIEQTIKSILDQKLNYPYEIIIYDDASTDNTQEIISYYYKSYPTIIKPLLQIENQWLGKGINGTTKFAYPETKGKYIALCEGDDYWIDPHKLQKQVDFLESHPEYVMCFHPVLLLERDGTINDDYLTTVPQTYETIEALAQYGNYIHTPSVVFKNILQSFPVEYSQTMVTDYFLYMLLAQHGKIGKLDDTMAVYRHQTGIWSSEQKFIRSLKFLHTLLLMHSVFQSVNSQVADILYIRSKNLFYWLLPDMSADSLNELRSGKDIATTVDTLILNKIQDMSRNNVYNLSAIQLLRHVIRKTTKRITG